MKAENKTLWLMITAVIIVMAFYFVTGNMQMNDDGFYYEGFAESLAKGNLDFKSFYGFQGLSFFAVPVFWLTRSHNSIIITSAIFSLLSIPLAYFVGKRFYHSSKAGIYFLILFLLTPYPYTTMMRGFQESALLFFILLIIYGSLNKKTWTPIAWAVGGIVKPFALTLFPLFIKDFWPKFSRGLNLCKLRFNLKALYVVVALAIAGAYLGASYYQTGHLVNNAAINSYQGNFDTGNPPPLTESFVIGIKGYLRVGANLFLHFRKIMISPLVIVVGALSLLRNNPVRGKTPAEGGSSADHAFEASRTSNGIRLRKEIILAILLNFLLVGSLTFSFSKYLLPMTTLLALSSVGYLIKHKWFMVLVFIDSFFVFLPIWNYFGYNYWSNFYLYLTPFWLAAALFAYESRLRSRSRQSRESERTSAGLLRTG